MKRDVPYILLAMGVFICALLTVVLCAVISQIRHDAVAGQKNRVRMHDAYIVGSALVDYEKNHRGSVPSSVNLLNVRAVLNRDLDSSCQLDLTPFHLLSSAGSESEKMDVVIEAPEYEPPASWHDWLRQTPSQAVIQVYRDGTVHSKIIK